MMMRGAPSEPVAGSNSAAAMPIFAGSWEAMYSSDLWAMAREETVVRAARSGIERAKRRANLMKPPRPSGGRRMPHAGQLRHVLGVLQHAETQKGGDGDTQEHHAATNDQSRDLSAA